MLPLSELSEAPEIDTLVFDLDDTFLEHQELDERAYVSLFRLREAGVSLVAATGRPAGFCDVLIRQWPLAAAIAENGGVYYTRGSGKQPMLCDPLAPDERRSRRRKLEEMAALLVAHFPSLVRADDDWARRTDVALDHNEHRQTPPEVVREAAQFAEALGARTFASSIHLHLTLDTADKATGFLDYARSIGRPPEIALAKAAFIGDSSNDRAAFDCFGLTFGVANVTRHLHLLNRLPMFKSELPRAAGFVQVADRLIELLAKGAA